MRQLLRRMHNAQKLKLIDGWEVVIGIEISLQPILKFSQVHRLNLVKYSSEPCRLGNAGCTPCFKVVDLAIRFGLGIDAYIDLCLHVKTTSTLTHQKAIKDGQSNCGPGSYRHSTWRSKRIGVTRAHLEEDAGKSTNLKACLALT